VADEVIKLALHERLEAYKGQPIAVLCARYWYRGILKEVGKDHVLLTNPRAVEVTGSASQDHPEREDVIPSDLMIRIDFMEIVCQPSWVYFEMSEKDVKKAEEDRKAGKKPEPVRPARR
jgi:hypothetical protein